MPVANDLNKILEAKMSKSWVYSSNIVPSLPIIPRGVVVARLPQLVGGSRKAHSRKAEIRGEGPEFKPQRGASIFFFFSSFNDERLCISF